MGIKEEIKQNKPFRSERTKLVLNAQYTGYQISDYLELFFKPWKLTQKQYNALRILRGAQGKGVSTGYIRDRMLVKKGDASRLVDRLVLKGLAVKCEAPSDRRLIEVTLSERGQELLREIDMHIHKVDDCVSHLTLEECVKLNELLDKCREQKPI